MIPQFRSMFAFAKTLSCALILCVCLAAAGFVMTHVQASSYVVVEEAGNLLPASGGADADVLPLNQNRENEEDEIPSSDPPGTDDPHNSTGDDVVVRIPR